MHPFDLKTALLAKHAQHIVVIHFPIALFLIGFFFDVLAQSTRSRALAAAAYYNLIAAALFTVPALITGSHAWQFALGGQKLKGILLDHIILAAATSILIGLVGWIHFHAKRSVVEILPLYRLPLELFAATLRALTAHLGGFLSGVNIPS